jgi:hypothetical protein
MRPNLLHQIRDVAIRNNETSIINEKTRAKDCGH